MNTLRTACRRCFARSYGTVTKNVMGIIDRQAIQHANEDGRRELLSRSNPKGIRPGSVIMVETRSSPKQSTASSSFLGVCVAIHRRGIDSSITLRNMVMRVGVEQRFPIYSPLVKSIKVVQQPTERIRRAKLFYLRDNPGRVFQTLQALWKGQQQQKQKQKA